jgi:hypothetical protein
MVLVMFRRFVYNTIKDTALGVASVATGIVIHECGNSAYSLAHSTLFKKSSNQAPQTIAAESTEPTSNKAPR